MLALLMNIEMQTPNFIWFKYPLHLQKLKTDNESRRTTGHTEWK